MEEVAPRKTSASAAASWWPLGLIAGVAAVCGLFAFGWWRQGRQEIA
jgi:hypothetical protein